jgi:membrane-associated protease RseP (regulator of RpoE activity)
VRVTSNPLAIQNCTFLATVRSHGHATRSTFDLQLKTVLAGGDTVYSANTRAGVEIFGEAYLCGPGSEADRRAGAYVGIGIATQKQRGLVTILSVTEDSPAWRAGLRAGDVIAAIDSVPVDSLSERELVEHIRGPKGSQVTLTIARPGGTKPIAVAVVRGEILVAPPTPQKEGNAGAVQSPVALEPGVATYLDVAFFADRHRAEVDGRVWNHLDAATKADEMRGLASQCPPSPNGEKWIEIIDARTGEVIDSLRKP